MGFYLTGTSRSHLPTDEAGQVLNTQDKAGRSNGQAGVDPTVRRVPWISSSATNHFAAIT